MTRVSCIEQDLRGKPWQIALFSTVNNEKRNCYCTVLLQQVLCVCVFFKVKRFWKCKRKREMMKLCSCFVFLLGRPVESLRNDYLMGNLSLLRCLSEAVLFIFFCLCACL